LLQRPENLKKVGYKEFQHSKGTETQIPHKQFAALPANTHFITPYLLLFHFVTVS
jgi:hypothetical protein